LLPLELAVEGLSFTVPQSLFATQMLWLTSIVVMTISATRIHRYLADFASETTHAYDMILITYVTTLTAVNAVLAGPNPHNARASSHMSTQTATALLFLV
jgi:hypothetical protein